MGILALFTFWQIVIGLKGVKATDVSDESIYPATWKNAAIQQFRDFQHSSIYGPAYNKNTPPKNMILFVGDGLSSSTITGARYLKAANMNKSNGDVVLDWELWPAISLLHTFSANRLTTDSASSATAFLCGAKTVQYALGLTGVKECCTCKRFDASRKIQSTLIRAQKNGLSTGIVTTTKITHATPAACYAHSRDRNHEVDPIVSPSDPSFVCEDIASQLISNGLDFNVILGGGSKMFYQNVSAVTPKTPGSRTDGKNLFAQWLREQQKRNRRHKLVFKANELKQLNFAEIDYLFGLMAPDHLDYEVHRTDQPSLSEMTEIAVKILSRNPKGYLLLVEGGRIDHGHHANQAKYALTETLALEKAVNLAMNRVNLNETLMVVTADHSHAYGVIGYGDRRRHVLDLDNSRVGTDGYPYLISAYFSGPGGSAKQPRRDPSNDRVFQDGYRQQALVPLASATHAADDVPLYAIGPLSQLFHRSIDNTYVAHATMFALCLEEYKEEPHCIRKNISPKRYVCPYQLLFLIGARILLTSVM
ncbi:intestinal-type alkaline phosphatase [Paragonimus heterotremus]|uniref:alkaline phosphatase n=1 Tax=Paragonimus heterotremus TaxID=100268 RepID=A0A8J4SYM6_9TREM|nr:intestinal-type alkaline phosphatase [Paragonimus heterotremus]